MLRLFKSVFVAIAMLAVAAATADAETVKLNSKSCALANNGDVTLAQALATPDAFVYDSGKFEKAAKHYWVKADIADLISGIDNPVMRLRIARHGDLELHVDYADAPAKILHYTSEDIKANWRGPSHTAFPLSGPNGENANIDFTWRGSTMGSLEPR